jgi:hypothetical protein
MRALDARLALFLVTGLAVGCGGARLTGVGVTAAGTGGIDAAAGAGDANRDGDVRVDGATIDGDGGSTDGDANGDAAPLPAPVVFATAPGAGTVHLILAGASVYWTERATGSVKKLATNDPGGTPTVVAMSQPLPGPLAADDANVYWANEGDKSIRKAPLAGGAASSVVTAPDVVSGLVARAGTLYFGAGASAYEVPVAGGAPTTLMTFLPCRTSRTGALAIDADHLYQTDYNLEFLTREKLDGTQAIDDRCAADPTTAPKVAAPDVITHSQGELFEDALVVVDGRLIWADGANLVARTVTGTNGATTLASSVDGNPITGFAVAGARLYFAEGGPTPADGTGDAIELASLDFADLADGGAPGEAKVVAAGQRNASELAASATHLFWVTTTGNDGAILRLPK